MAQIKNVTVSQTEWTKAVDLVNTPSGSFAFTEYEESTNVVYFLEARGGNGILAVEATSKPADSYFGGGKIYEGDDAYAYKAKAVNGDLYVRGLDATTSTKVELNISDNQ